MKNEKKVSEMILNLAAKFIEMGETEEERQQNLDVACTAWNLSILPKSTRNKEYNNYLNAMRSLIKDREVMKWFKLDLNGLIQAKLTLYPNEKKPIVSAKLENVGSNRYVVTAAFARQLQSH
jgi:hypothetical protein